jgi:Zn-dependent protease with chaperone function
MRVRLGLVVLPLVVLGFVGLASAGAADDPPPTGSTVAQTAVPPDAGPVAVPEPSEKAMRYFRSGNVLWVVGTLWGLVVPAVILFTGWSARLRDLAARVSRRLFLQRASYFVLLSVATFVIDLPLAWYSSFVRPHAYELSNQTAGKWWSDALIGLAVGTLIGALVVGVPYMLLRTSPRRWWLWTGLLASPFLIVGLLIQPIFIDPLFNKFGPMKDQGLESEILALAGRAGIAGSRVYEVEKSVDTKTVNAYVTGFLSSKRIVLWDTLIQKLDRRETLFVMGHEMGHYVLGHVWQGIVIGTLLILLGLYVVHRTAGRLIARFGHRFGFTTLGDTASLPLLLLLLSLTSLVLSPALLALSRHAEHESDRFGLELTRDNHAAARAFVKLQQENLSNPRPGWLYKLWRSSHPPLGERIDFCNEYRPWEKGEALRYGDRMTATSSR